MPRSDTCTRCDKLAIAIDAAHGLEKENFEREQSDHQTKAKAGYTMIKGSCEQLMDEFGPLFQNESVWK